MTKLAITTLSSLENQSSAISTINANFERIASAIENTLSRDGTLPNTMSSQLDMNSQKIVNLPLPVSDTEPVRLLEFAQARLGNVTAADVAAAIGYTPANKAGDTFTGNVNFSSGLVTTTMTAASDAGIEGNLDVLGKTFFNSGIITGKLSGTYYRHWWNQRDDKVSTDNGRTVSNYIGNDIGANGAGSKTALDVVCSLSGAQLLPGTVTGLTWSGGVATMTYTGGMTYAAGDKVIIRAVNPAGYNSESVTAISAGAGTLTYAVAVNPGAYVSGGEIGGQNRFYTAAFPRFYAYSSDGGTGLTLTTSKGSVYALGAGTWVRAGATNLYGASSEIDIAMEAGSSACIKTCLSLIGGGNGYVGEDAVQGTLHDSLLSFTKDISTGIGYRLGISFGRDDAQWPISSTGTIIGTSPSNGGAVALEAANGIDFSAVAFSGFSIKMPSFWVNGAGFVSTPGIVGLSLINAANDAAAAGAGVIVGQMYRNGSVLMVRVV